MYGSTFCVNQYEKDYNMSNYDKAARRHSITAAREWMKEAIAEQMAATGLPFEAVRNDLLERTLKQIAKEKTDEATRDTLRQECREVFGKIALNAKGEVVTRQNRATIRQSSPICAMQS